ncbi:class I SAM-dependent methyltransferase [Sphingomonas sabuli]|uniref:Class I SAM-dependent methyltransferase n=1 Tax=Sphingomonas sabuli TaxID=2764186 RepID=A0A7G9L5X7_9SPHN|nr:class I SAM-dependent methyltransferase [Sphingomonas sabuli]QNM84026.1 class I SAM-dependent methyltransferase [Sphingomonas sabuli]
MERVVYDRMAELDERHWWYVARREVLAALIARTVRPPRDAAILEVGCGTGHNLAMLARFGTVDGIEIDAVARAHAERRLGRAVGAAPLPGLPGIARAHYDLVAALDVIEHIDDDAGALAGIAACLKPGGKLLMTVPAHQWMWSAHDDLNHHKRRYSKAALRRLVEASPLRLDAIGYFNSILFPLAVAARLAAKATGRGGKDDAMPPAPVNYVFERVFAAERRLVGALPMPPGLSLFAVAAAT